MIAQVDTALTMHSLGHFPGPQKGESSPQPAPSLCGGSNLGRLVFGGGGGGQAAVLHGEHLLCGAGQKPVTRTPCSNQICVWERERTSADV